MPYESLDGYAYIDPEDEALLRELFLTSAITDRLAELDPDARANAEREYLEGVRGWLTTLQDHPKNLGDGGIEPGKLHVRIPGTQRYFFSIKQGLLSLAVTVGPAAVVTLLVPPVIIVKLLPATASAGKAIWDATAVLKSDSDFDVYTAVVRAIERNSRRTLGTRGATVEDIEESFGRDSNLIRPGNLADKLSDLCQRNVLRKDTSSTVTQYFKRI